MVEETNCTSLSSWVAVAVVVLVSGFGCDGAGSVDSPVDAAGHADMDASARTDSVRDVGKDARAAEDGRVEVPDVGIECDETCSVLESCGFEEQGDECLRQCEQRAYRACYLRCVGEPTRECITVRRCRRVCASDDVGGSGDADGA